MENDFRIKKTNTKELKNFTIKEINAIKTQLVVQKIQNRTKLPRAPCNFERENRGILIYSVDKDYVDS